MIRNVFYTPDSKERFLLLVGFVCFLLGGYASWRLTKLVIRLIFDR